MYIARDDMEILETTMDLRQAYYEKFGEDFAMFNYETFPGTEYKRPAAQYKEMLEEALAKDEPTRIKDKLLELHERLGYFD